MVNTRVLFFYILHHLSYFQIFSIHFRKRIHRFLRFHFKKINSHFFFVFFIIVKHDVKMYFLYLLQQILQNTYFSAYIYPFFFSFVIFLYLSFNFRIFILIKFLLFYIFFNHIAFYWDTATGSETEATTEIKGETAGETEEESREETRHIDIVIHL